MKLLKLFLPVCLWLPLGVPTSVAEEKAIDPFDYNFCGGERVYPVVGIDFSTACGPRNMLALGRRGKLMWYFPPSVDGKIAERRGVIKLNPQQLDKLSLLAEVVQIAEPPPPRKALVQYKLGLNFSARPTVRVHTAMHDNDFPSTELFKAILNLVPDQPLLPACSSQLRIFDPKQHRLERIEKMKVVNNDVPKE